MNFRQARYILDEAAIMLARRKAACALAVVIMGLSLLILIVFLMITLNIAAQIEKTSEETRIFVYLAEGLSVEAAREIQHRLLAMPGIEEVVYISREQALAELRETLGPGSELLGELVDNPLPDAFRARPKQAWIRGAALEQIAAEAEKLAGVAEVRYGREWFERGERLVRGFYMVDLALGAIILLSVIFVIYNTVRLTILQRLRTIEVLKLVGADNAFIRLPFVIEGALHGIAAALLAILLLAAIFALTSRYLPGIVFLRHEALVLFVVLCALLGAAGSYSAMRRFLRI